MKEPTDKKREGEEDVVAQPEATAEAQEPNWGVEVLEDVKDIQPSKFHPEKKWMATHFKIEKPDGTSEEVESTKNILEIASKDGTKIEVPAFAVNEYHFPSRYIEKL